MKSPQEITEEVAALDKVAASKPAKRKKGVTLLEYAIVASIIAALAIAVITALGGKVNNTFTKINSVMPNN